MTKKKKRSTAKKRRATSKKSKAAPRKKKGTKGAQKKTRVARKKTRAAGKKTRAAGKTKVARKKAKRASKKSARSGRAYRIQAAAFSGDGAVLATSAQKRVYLWDVTGAKPKKTGSLRTTVDASRLAVDRSGERVAAAVAGFSEVRIRAAKGATTGALLHEIRARGAVTCFGFAPDGRFVIGEVERIGEDGLKARSYISVYDLERGGTELFRTAVVDLPIRDIAFSSDGLLLFLGFGGGVVVVFDLEAKRELFRFPNVDGPDIGARIAAAFSFSQDGRRAAISYGDVVEVWPVDGGDRVARIDLPARTWSVALDSGGTHVVCGAPAAGVFALDGHRVANVDVPHNVVATPDGARVLASDRIDLAKGPKLAAVAA
jgi:WD40 repeat protein